ncbi:MAG: thioredoxin [Chloroflexi bacterium]|nr:thioredoxin [Chloroflexota bacterium]
MAFNTPIHTNLQSIDRVLNAGLPVVLVFWRDNCSPCRRLHPTLKRLAEDYAGEILFAKVDVDTQPELAERYRISQLPGLVFVKNGETEETAYGAAAEADLRQWCDYLINGGTRPAPLSGPSEGYRSSAPPTAPASNASAQPAQTGGKPIQLTDANFDQTINGDQPVLVDFWAPWCGPCHMVAPTVESLAREFDGKLVVGKVNVDENQRTSSRYGIMSIPTLMIFKNGKAVDTVVGALPEHVLRARVLPHV